MNTSCIRNPERNRFIQLHQWQVDFCQNNHCAALLLSLFINWHDWKLRNDQYYRRCNDIAQMHDDGRPHNENAYLFFTTDQLIKDCMGLYGKKAIVDGIEFLIALGAISKHSNPNPRYHFDKTKYFKFNPDICNQWIAQHYPLQAVSHSNQSQAIDYTDTPKTPDREVEKTRRSGKKDQPSGEKRRAITNTTNNTTNKNQSINPREDFLGDEKQAKDRGADVAIQPIVAALLAKGMAQKKLYPDTLIELSRLQQQGVTLETFVAAFDLAKRATQGSGFGMAYLLKVALDLHQRAKPKPIEKAQGVKGRVNHDFSNVRYETDLSNGLAWIEGGQ